jgi:hypothetical protein
MTRQHTLKPCSDGVDVYRCTIHDAATKQQHQFTFNKCYSPTGNLAEEQVDLIQLIPLMNSEFVRRCSFDAVDGGAAYDF